MPSCTTLMENKSREKHSIWFVYIGLLDNSSGIIPARFEGITACTSILYETFPLVFIGLKCRSLYVGNKALHASFVLAKTVFQDENRLQMQGLCLWSMHYQKLLCNATSSRRYSSCLLLAFSDRCPFFNRVCTFIKMN